MIRTLLLVVLMTLAVVAAVLDVQSRGEIARYRDMRRM
jgi:hypothetical protein